MSEVSGAVGNARPAAVDLVVYRNVHIVIKDAVHDSLYCRERRVDYDACGLHQEHSNVDAAQASDHHYKPKTILIADDSAMMRTVIRQAIERDTEFEICGEAVDGTDAVSKAKELSPDLIILDVRMPGLNGMEVAGILRYALPKLRIALVTMYAEDLGRNFTSLFRIDAVVAKANGLTELTAHIRSLLTDRHPDIATSYGTLTVP